MALHIINGLAILALTIVMSYEAINYYNGELRWNKSVHSAMGLAILFATCIIVIFGFLALGGMSYLDSDFWGGIRLL